MIRFTLFTKEKRLNKQKIKNNNKQKKAIFYYRRKIIVEFNHIPVLLNECIGCLNIKKGGIYVDGTLGGGGHSSCVLKELNNTGKL